MAIKRLSGPMSRLLKLFGAIARDKRGVAAVEFAFVVPLLLCMYFVTLEASQGIETDKKVNRIASNVADLIAQQTDITPAEVMAIMDIAKTTVAPYNRSTPTIEVISIQLDNSATPVAKAVWSLKLDASGNPVAVVAKNSVVTVPTDLRVANAAYVQVKSTLVYKPVIAWAADTNSIGLLNAFSNITMGQTMLLVPRQRSDAIKCTACP
jgi:Flp pilus assembly protein TadG